MDDTIAKNLWVMFENQEYLDFEFHFPDEKDSDKIIEKIGVHRIVLVSKSRVFKANLSSGLKDDSPLVLQDVSPKAFRNLVRVMYEQACILYSVEEACDLFELGHRYDVEKARLVAKNFLLEHIDVNNVKLINKCALLFNDAELIKRVWDFLESSLLVAINGSFCGSAGTTTQNFEIQDYSKHYLVKNLDKYIEEIREIDDVYLKASRAIGLLGALNEETKKLFNMIVPKESLRVRSQIEWTTPTASFLRLNKEFNMAGKNYCQSNCSNRSWTNGLQAIYNKYKHDDLSRYEPADIQRVYDYLKDRLA